MGSSSKIDFEKIKIAHHFSSTELEPIAVHGQQIQADHFM
jgi:hypothetical protein